MKNIPNWVLKIIQRDNLFCNKCRKVLKEQDLISIGIQESSIEPHNDKLCVGLSCPDCKDITIFEIKEMSLVEFAFDLLDKETEASREKSKKKSKSMDILKELGSDSKESDEEKPKPRRRRSVNKKSKITKKEVNEVVRFLESTKTHEDFLVAMGLSPEQIGEYNYKQGEEE